MRLAALGVSCLALAACSMPTAAPDATASRPASSVRSPSTRPTTAPSPTSAPSPSQAASPSRAASPSTAPGSALPSAPKGYRTEVVHRGTDHPDDLVLDASGALLYSDYTNGTISRLNPDGSATVVHRGLDGPEGMVLLADGTLVVAEENTNRLLAFRPGQAGAVVLTTLPGRPLMVTCHQGVDGIAWDATTSTLVVPDPVTGTIYRIAPDGRSRTVLARGFVHPVGAAVGPDGAVFVADECGGDVWRLGAGGARSRAARAAMPDDVALDGHGNLLVTDVRHTRHDLRRWPLGGGRSTVVPSTVGPSTVLASSGLIEPQGLLVDGSGRIYVADDQARAILRLTPAS
jgi:sugar lactone lactonase YvrE